MKSITSQIWRRSPRCLSSHSRVKDVTNHTNSLDTQTRAPEPSPRFTRTTRTTTHPPFSGTADIGFIPRQARGSGARTSQSIGSRTHKGYPTTCRSLLKHFRPPLRSQKTLPVIECVTVSWPPTSSRIGASAAPPFTRGHRPRWSLAFNLPRNLADSSSKHWVRYRRRFELVCCSPSR